MWNLKRKRKCYTWFGDRGLYFLIIISSHDGKESGESGQNFDWFQPALRALKLV